MFVVVISSGILCLAEVSHSCLKSTGLIPGLCRRSDSPQFFLAKEPWMNMSCCAFVKCRQVPQASSWREHRHKQTMRPKKQTCATTRGGATACHTSVLRCYFTCCSVMLMPFASCLRWGWGVGEGCGGWWGFSGKRGEQVPSSGWPPHTGVRRGSGCGLSACQP